MIVVNGFPFMWVKLFVYILAAVLVIFNNLVRFR